MIESDETIPIGHTDGPIVEAPGFQSEPVLADAAMISLLAAALADQDVTIFVGHLESEVDTSGYVESALDYPGTYVLFAYGSQLNGEATLTCLDKRQPIFFSGIGNEVAGILDCSLDLGGETGVVVDAWNRC